MPGGKKCQSKPFAVSAALALALALLINSPLEALEAKGDPALAEANALADREEFSAALRAIETASKKTGPQSLYCLKLKTRIYTGLNDLPKAQKCIELAFRLAPHDPELYYLKACADDDTHNPKLAISDLNRALALNPRMARAYLGRARAYFILSENLFDGDHLQQARDDLSRAIALDPNLADAYDCQGVAMIAEKGYEQAVKSFTRAIGINKYKAIFYVHRANTYNALNEPLKALPDLNQYVALEPNNRASWIARGRTLELLKRYNEALKDYNQAHQISGNSCEALSKRAALLVKMQRYKEAVEDYNFMIKKSPLDDETYEHRGKAWQALGQYDHALDDFNAAIELSPQLAGHYETRAELYKLMKKPQLIRADLNKAAALRSSKI